MRSEKDFLAHGQRTGGSIKIGGDHLNKGKTPAAKNLYDALLKLYLGK